MVKIGHAVMSENSDAGWNGKAKAGDQTGKEICIRDWYNKPWNVMLICNDTVIARKAAAYMKAICNDDDFGYDQSQRTTGYLNIVKANGVVEKATPGEFDCSSLVSACYKLAGLNISESCTTRNIRKALLNTGKFTAYTDSAHLTTDAYATVGAVYLNEGSHVVMALENGSKAVVPSTSNNSGVVPVVSTTNNETTIWNFLKSKGLNDYAVAGIMGNLYVESGLSQINLQNNGNAKLGMTDAEYTAAVDSGSYTNFVRDSYGYGLAQWTWWQRKEALQKYAKSKNKSIGDVTIQLEYLYNELSVSYKGCYNKLKAATSVREASNAFLFDFERPANQGTSAQNQRASYGENYYNKYAKKTTTVNSGDTSSSTPKYVVGKSYTLQVELNVRTGAGTNFAKKLWSQLTADGRKHDVNKNGALDKGTVVTCLDVKNVGSDIWIKAPSGWLAAYYKNQYYIK